LNANEIISSGMLELYASNLLTEAEKAEVESWCAQYPEVAAELAAIETALEGYARAGAVEPAPQVKDRVFEQMNTVAAQTPLSANNNTENGRVVKMSHAWKWAAAASVALLIGSVVINLTTYNKYTTASKELAQTREALAAEKNGKESLQKDWDIIQSKYSEPVKLNGLPAAPDATAKIYWIKNTGDVYVDASNLPEAPAGKQYQLWAIINGTPSDAGLIIKTDKESQARIQKMNTFGKVEAFAITLEKEGGSSKPGPEGDMYVLGKVI
jgi:anti-sigma-K factor RskA